MIYIGKIVNTHGIKGEIRVISDFEYKDEVFKIDSIIYINSNRYIIKTYRHHKIYEMITLEGINSIDEALKFKGKDIYIDRNDYEFKGYLNIDLIGLDVYDSDGYKGKVVEILKGIKHDLLVVDGKKRHMIPNISNFIEKIDLDNKKIFIKYIRGLDLEN